MSKHKITSIALLSATTCFFSHLFAEEANTHTTAYTQKKAEHHKSSTNPMDTKSDTSFTAGASYTFWAPYIIGSGMAYGTGTPTIKGNTIHPSLNAVSGFKAMLGANLNHDDWNVKARYTWFFHDPTTQRGKTSTDFQYAGRNGTLAIVDSLDSRYFIFFNRVDLYLNKCMQYSNYTKISPWMGLLGAWDNHSLNIDSEVNIDATDATVDGHLKQQWWSIGPYGGAELCYNFTDSLGLYLSSGAALLLAEHHAYSTGDNTLLGFMGNNVNKVYNVETMFETSLGMRWKKVGESMTFGASIAWEIQTYFEHIDLPFFKNIVQSYGNYSMQGLTASVEANF